jgi:hypothetical protein
VQSLFEFGPLCGMVGRISSEWVRKSVVEPFFFRPRVSERGIYGEGTEAQTCKTFRL